jgi:hypothetical protein
MSALPTLIALLVATAHRMAADPLLTVWQALVAAHETLAPGRSRPSLSPALRDASLLLGPDLHRSDAPGLGAVRDHLATVRQALLAAGDRLALAPSSTLHLALAQACDLLSVPSWLPGALFDLETSLLQGSEATDALSAALAQLPGGVPVPAPPAPAPTVPAPPLDVQAQKNAAAAAYFRNALTLALKGARLVEGDERLEAEAHHAVLALEALVRGLTDRVDAERAELAEQAEKAQAA